MARAGVAVALGVALYPVYWIVLTYWQEVLGRYRQAGLRIA